MKFSRFAERFTRRSGILELMDDLGRAMEDGEDIRMLGGGNPAHIDELNALWRRRMTEILENGYEFEEALANYGSPGGQLAFLEALASLLNREYGWYLTPENIAVVNGSQNAFFIILNLFGGVAEDGKVRKVLFPLCPEYIGYADQALDAGSFTTRPARIEETRENFFKYRVDFSGLDIGDDVAALCVSRPTNPTGNVLTDGEVNHLAELAAEKDIPLIIDNAYGAPFPSILFREVTPIWKRNVILGMSLSKLGLPSSRTGIIIADEEVIRAVSACNAVMSLSTGTIGQAIVRPLIESGEILDISRNTIRPFYEERSRRAIGELREAFGNDVDYRIHESEGAIFLWLWLRNLAVPSMEIYRRLKERNVLVIPGEYFFYGLEEPWSHSTECLRLSYAQDPVKFREATTIIAEEARKASR